MTAVCFHSAFMLISNVDVDGKAGVFEESVWVVFHLEFRILNSISLPEFQMKRQMGQWMDK